MFLINHGDADATVPAGGADLLGGGSQGRDTPVPAGGVVVLRQAR
ncbi:MAG TPA: hypothetical protein VFD04_05025 [Actinomycetes bacterium]|nr:hypothetical protein [Actinomycetes bacterium]